MQRKKRSPKLQTLNLSPKFCLKCDFCCYREKNNETNNKDKKKEVATCPPSLVLALTVPYSSNQAMRIMTPDFRWVF